MLLYDHLIRLTADAPNRSGDLREGSLGALGAVLHHNLLFARNGSDPLVSNVPADEDAGFSIAIERSACFLGFEPRSGANPYERTSEFLGRLEKSLRWTIEEDGEPVGRLMPRYEICVSRWNSPWSKNEPPRPVVSVRKMAVRCEIVDEDVLEAINTGRYEGVDFDTRIVRLMIRGTPT